jgi:beta-glucanase (GH16 family)
VKALKILVALALGALGASQNASAVTNTAPAGYKWNVIWSDEFNYTGAPDPTKWNYHSGAIGNNEQQGYTSSNKNSYVEDGRLRITAYKEPTVYGRTTYPYSSARLNTRNKFTVQYGRIEASIKMPGSIGAWPAFWTLGTESGWPNSGEIDIVEYSPGKTNGGPAPANYIDRNLIYRQGDGNIRSQYHFSSLHGVTPTDGYHTYAVEWDETSIRWYYDDINFATTLTTPYLLDAYAGTNPTANPHYLLLNLAMGGTGGGGIDPSFVSDSMYVDYVRVSKLSPIPEPTSIACLFAAGAALLRRRRAQDPK